MPSVKASVVLVPLFVMLTSYPLLFLDRIGMELQNPFDTRRVHHLPLDEICHTIERNVLEMLRHDFDSPQEDSLQISPEMKELLMKGGDGRDTYIS